MQMKIHLYKRNKKRVYRQRKKRKKKNKKMRMKMGKCARAAAVNAATVPRNCISSAAVR